MISYNVSVIVPVFNVEKYLDHCISSIVKQTYKNLEIILVNDGSTDNSVQICRTWEKKDPRIVLVEKENGGLSDARNAGLNIASGDYYSFIDSDDYILEDTIQSMLDSILRSNSDIAICNMMRFYEDGSQMAFYRPSEMEMVLSGEDRYKTLIQPSVCNKLFKKDLFDGIRFPKGKYYEDTYIYHEVLFRAESIVYTGKDSYWYLSRPESILGGKKYNDRYFDFIEAVYCRARFLLENGVQPYGDDACLSLYAAMSNAEKCLTHTEKNKEKFNIAREQYQYAYKALISGNKKLSFKQKTRLILLRYLPAVHAKLY